MWDSFSINFALKNASIFIMPFQTNIGLLYMQFGNGKLFGAFGLTFTYYFPHFCDLETVELLHLVKNRAFFLPFKFGRFDSQIY